MIAVLDASVTLTWLLRDASEKDEAYSFAVLKSLRSSNSHCLVPITWGLEVANVVARSEAKGLVTETQSGAFLEMLDSLSIEIDGASATQALSGTLQLARRFRLSAYDASYLELAMRLKVPIATLDDDLLKAAVKGGVKRLESK
jgi:predicted nucleic acid-binding protein